MPVKADVSPKHLPRTDGARLGDAIRALSGWRRAALAFVSGALSALSFAPFDMFPFLLLAIAVLVLLIDGAQMRKRPFASAVWVGWLWGFGQFLFGLYWVGYAFLVDATDHAWQIPFVEALLPGGLALFVAAAAAAASMVWRAGSSRILVFALAYGVAEWLRGHVLTGFPWNLPAYGWGASLGVLQSTALFGSYGLSLLTILFGASLARLCDRDADRWKLPVGFTALFAALWMGGDLRLALVHPGDVPGVRLRLIQPDVAQKDKFRLRLRRRNWHELIELSLVPAAVKPTVIVWPEAAPPFLLARIPEALDAIAALTGTKRVLMTGAVRGYALPEGGARFFNSFYIFGPGGTLVGTYDKFHLVPFGEYVPLSGLLERLGISKLVDGPQGFSSGGGPHSFILPNAPSVGPLICYEIIFPGEVVGAHRPGWLVNVTDDSWFGPSTGPRQHLLTARVRAIEEGIPVVRDANTGISAVIDPLGRIRAELGLGRMGILDSYLPRAVLKTPFARLGDIGFALMLAACATGAWAGAGWRRQSDRENPFGGRGKTAKVRAGKDFSCL